MRRELLLRLSILHFAFFISHFSFAQSLAIDESYSQKTIITSIKVYGNNYYYLKAKKIIKDDKIADLMMENTKELPAELEKIGKLLIEMLMSPENI